MKNDLKIQAKDIQSNSKTNSALHLAVVMFGIALKN
jgi:hypothetical protein